MDFFSSFLDIFTSVAACPFERIRGYRISEKGKDCSNTQGWSVGN